MGIVRTFLIAAIAVIASPQLAAGDAAIKYQLVEDAALGIELPTDHQVLTEGRAAPAIATCLARDAPTGSALFWLELSQTGMISAARVHGGGKPTLDTCLAAALRKAAATNHLPGPTVLVGHLDLGEPGKDGFLPSPRKSRISISLDPHGAKWQLTISTVAYRANRALDIGQALDGVSTAVAACAPKRGANARTAEAMAWTDGKAIVRSGTPMYDACVAKALDGIKLPVPESAMWMQLTIAPPSEALAPRRDSPALSHPHLLHDALTTAVRSRKAILLDCLDGHPKAALTSVTVELRATKASIQKVSTGDADADACVRSTFQGTPIAAAIPDDKLVLEVTIEPE